MQRGVLWVSLGFCFLLGGAGVFLSTTSASDNNVHPEFQQTWERTDQPVADGASQRTWIWGPTGHTDAFLETYADAPDGQRLVQYFDKTRMELTDPDADRDDLWRVTNGLLARELITGEMQTGDTMFDQRRPAEIQVAGDTHPDTPTYATFESVLDSDPLAEDEPITHTINRHGMVGTDQSLRDYGVTAEYYVEETGHTVASVFWTFMNASGTVLSGEDYRDEPLFENPFFGVGLPITEAYWMNIPVDDVWQDVLTQCFERRCLTYTPANPDGWQVEAGNIGQHYYAWRYDERSGGRITDEAESPIDLGPTQEELGSPVAGACEANTQATLLQVTDSLGNVNPNSWAKGSGGDWPGGYGSSPVIDIGQQLTFTVEADGDCAPLEYRVQRYRSDRDITVTEPWTETNVFSYTVEPEDVGDYLMLIVDVRNQDPRRYYEDRDDYTYLTYIVR
jgi:hypothetical protein